MFDRSSYLYEEPANLLKQELREPAIYNAIIKAIAEGASRLNDITTKVGEENSVVAKYLKTLIDLGIVKKETPITEKPGKKTIYLLADNFFRFWYRFVPVNASAIDSGRIAKTYPHAVKQYFPDYMGLIFEKMCQDYLLYYANDLPIELSEIGQWWGTDPQKRSRYKSILSVGRLRAMTISSAPANIAMKNRFGRTGTDSGICSSLWERNKLPLLHFSKGGFTDGLLQAQERGEVQLLTLADIFE